MSFKIKFMLMLLVLMVVGLPLVMKGPDGRPVMTLNDWIPNVDQLPIDKAAISHVVDKIQQAPESMGSGAEASGVMAASQTGPATLSAGSGKMYKWKDEKGRWHFSHQKPVAATQVSMETLPEVENVMEAPVNKGDNSSSIRFPGGFEL